jgi:hypothetical protein
MTTLNLEFYDHATNHRNAAEASAVARARRTAIDDGTAYRVETDKFYWNGCRYDALGLAKSLQFNNYAGVKLIDPKGHEVDFVAEKY